MTKIRYWLAEKIMRLAWFISPSRSLQKRIFDYTQIYGASFGVINPKDVYLEKDQDE